MQRLFLFVLTGIFGVWASAEYFSQVRTWRFDLFYARAMAATSGCGAASAIGN